ncbi:hypothetical protein VNO78_04609 [Psophocarpus tetragonolobus]|uniref:Uncharacterized protein n=1 Tax=Psophocarpus tetragonolobus TaxID=3891 RepID=A0AAN9TF20_PSOTE
MANMADSLAGLLRLLDQVPREDEPPSPPLQPRRNRNPRPRAPRHNARSPPQSLNNSGTQNIKGLINNTGYVEGNGNGSIIFGGFDSTTNTYY